MAAVLLYNAHETSFLGVGCDRLCSASIYAQGIQMFRQVSQRIYADPFLIVVEGFTHLLPLYFILSYRANNVS